MQRICVAKRGGGTHEAVPAGLSAGFGPRSVARQPTTAFVGIDVGAQDGLHAGLIMWPLPPALKRSTTSGSRSRSTVMRRLDRGSHATARADRGRRSVDPAPRVEPEGMGRAAG